MIYGGMFFAGLLARYVFSGRIIIVFYLASFFTLIVEAIQVLIVLIRGEKFDD